jgi:hypothetical protein
MAAILTTSCGSTSMLTSWSDPNYTGGKLQHVLVIGVGKDQVIRRLFEDMFAERLSNRRTQATGSYILLSDPSEISKETVGPLVTEHGFTHVLVTRLVDRKTITDYAPATVGATYVPVYPQYYSGWYSYYSTSYTTVVSPGYTYETELVNLETNIYDVASEKLIWSGLTETETGGRIEGKLREFIDVVMSEMGRAKLL